MGARFEALFMGVLTAVSNLGCIFFRILTSGLEQCVWLLFMFTGLPQGPWHGRVRLLPSDPLVDDQG